MVDRALGWIARWWRYRAPVRLARWWRPLLARPVFVAVAGTAGKTTAKEMVHHLLSARGQVDASPGSDNELHEVARAILRFRPTSDFCVAEMSEHCPGAMDEPLELIRPTIGVITVVGFEHWSAFGSREAIACELSKLVKALPVSGTAVLNADDPLVRALSQGFGGRVICYGISPGADLRAEDVEAVWPNRLSFTVTFGEAKAKVQTQLCGAHWMPSVLGAIGAGLAAGMSLGECAERIASVPPFEGRMQPVVTADGVTFIRDDFKAPLWGMDACAEFMKAARATRKIAIIGTVSDMGASGPERLQKLARKWQEIADVTLFVGALASCVLKVRRADKRDALRVFSDVRSLAENVKGIVREGDLVLLKGGNTQDHLQRVVLHRNSEVSCWRDDCRRQCFCTECQHRHETALSTIAQEPNAKAAARDFEGSLPVLEPGEQVVVGLGNPEERFAGSPHNVGYGVVDLIAGKLQLEWEVMPEAWIARGENAGRRLCLVKARVAMNVVGAQIGKLAERMEFGPDRCILVFDDLSLPLGRVRSRQTGSAGGHRGVASILAAFQTDAIRRVKIGIAIAGSTANKVDYVLSPFPEAERSRVVLAKESAVEHVLQLLAEYGRG